MKTTKRMISMILEYTKKADTNPLFIVHDSPTEVKLTSCSSFQVVYFTLLRSLQFGQKQSEQVQTFQASQLHCLAIRSSRNCYNIRSCRFVSRQLQW